MESSLKQSMSDMMKHFNEQMAAFQKELHSSQASGPPAKKLEAEFSAFRSFITSAIGNLQQQLELLTQEIDQLDMRGRRKILLLHGVEEGKEEDTALVVVRVVRERLNLAEYCSSDIKRCHRMGRTSIVGARPILVKFHDITTKDKVWFSKTKLKGTGITLSEFLTKRRHDTFMAARQKFGISRCWTRDGAIFVLGDDGTRHRVKSLSDLNQIPVPDVSSKGLANSESDGKPKKQPPKPRQTRVKKPSSTDK